MLHGEPNITWESFEVKAFIVKENLQYAIIGKFSYGNPDMQELRKSIQGQPGIKSECSIGFFDLRHILKVHLQKAISADIEKKRRKITRKQKVKGKLRDK